MLREKVPSERTRSSSLALRGRELRRRATQATLIYEVGQRISSKLKLDTLLSEIVTAVQETFDYYGTMLLLLDKKSKVLTMKSIAGGYAKVFPTDLRLAVGEGMIGQAALTHKTKVSNDVSKDPDYVQKAHEITKSELSIPIKSYKLENTVSFGTEKILWAGLLLQEFILLEYKLTKTSKLNGVY